MNPVLVIFVILVAVVLGASLWTSSHRDSVDAYDEREYRDKPDPPTPPATPGAFGY